MNPSLEPDPRFRSWLLERSPRLAPSGLLERAMNEALAAPQATGWTPGRPLARIVPLMAASAGIVVVLVVGTLLSGGPRGPTGPAPDPSERASFSSAPSSRPQPTPAASVPASSTPAAAPTPSPGPIAFRTWTRHAMPDPAPDIFGGGTPFGVIRGGEGYVALGAVVSRQGIPGSLTVIWASGDGITWQLVEAGPEFTDARITGVASDGERHVVVGEGLLAPCCGVGQAAWIGSDGMRWSRASGPPPTVVSTAPGGFVGATVERSNSRFVASADGNAWAEASGWLDGEVIGLAADAGRGVVAVGHQRRPADDADAGSASDLVIWRSPDGFSWEGADVLVRNAVPTAVAPGPAGAVIAGQQYRTTRDGGVSEMLRIWRLTSTGPVLARVPDSHDDARQIIDHIAVVGDTLVATGQEAADGVESLLVLVSSDAGATWTRLPAQDAFTGVTVAVTGLIASPDGLVAVGRQWDPEAGHMVPVAWTAAR